MVAKMMARPARAKLISAFAAIYLIWGSTYLAIKYAIETLPPLLMAGSRFIIAGLALYWWARRQGASPPTRRHWRSAAIIGALLLLGGNGLVVWAEQRVATGLTALLIATEPLWIVILNWLGPARVRPNQQVIIGLLLGFTGMVILIGPGALGGYHEIDLLGAAGVISATLCWAIGSLYGQRAETNPSPVMASGMQMLAGGFFLMIVGTTNGEWVALNLQAISVLSLASFGYLIIFGSIVAFTAYSWLLRVEAPARVATYAYVNPLVAVFLGWLVASEAISPRMIFAMSIIIGAVLLITTQSREPSVTFRSLQALEKKE